MTTEVQYIRLVAHLRSLISRVEHQACGVDSYSLQDFAVECMSTLEPPLEPSDYDQVYGPDLTDEVARALILVVEVQRWEKELRPGLTFDDLLAEITEAYEPGG